MLLVLVTLGVVSAINSNEIKIQIGESPNIDIVLSKAETNVNLTNFEKDLKTKLEEQGIELEKVNISSVETSSMSSNAQDAATIFNTWKRIGVSAPWYFNGTSIINPENTNGYTGFLYPDGKYSKIKLSYNNYSSDSDDDTMGAVIRFNVNEDGTSTGYVFAIDRGGYEKGLYKIVNKSFSSSTALSRMATKVASISNNWKYSWINYRLEAENNNIKVYMNDELIIDYTDNDNPILEGSYGFVSASQANSMFKDINAELEQTRTLKEILQEPDWRENSLRFVVNVEDNENEKYTDDIYLANISSKMINDDINFLAWGTDTNKKQLENIIKNNNNKGEYIDNTNYEAALERTVAYIKEEVEKYETASKTKNYVLVDMPHNVIVTPEELKNNTIDRLYTEGKWKVNHDYTYFENDNGQYKLNGKYADSLIEGFDKVGKYEIIYKKDKVAEVYVHRKPIALFNIERNKVNIVLNDLSYDLDEQSKNNGISEVEWSYKKITDENWTEGKLTRIEEGITYLIRLRVKDNQGTWSEYETKYVTTNEGEPIAAFQVVNDRSSIYEELEVIDTSYDPANLEITERTWTLYKDNTKVYTGETVPADFSTYGIGDYKLTLTVKNSSGTVSEEYRQNFTIIDDEFAPEIIVDKPEASSLNEIEVNVQFIDNGGSGFNSFKYAITTSKEPVTEWSEDVAEASKKFTLSTVGEQYIHIIAKDNAGNETEEIILGSYVIEPKQITLEIEKYDNSDVTLKLGGIEFEIEQPTSELFETRTKELVTDEKGRGSVSLDVISAGEHIYSITETESILGYQDIPSIDLKIAFDENGKIILANENSEYMEIAEKTEDRIKVRIANVKKEATKSVTINMTNKDNDGVVIPISKYEITVTDNTGKTITKEVTTDKNGNIKLDGIPIEEWVYIELKQIEVPDGYVLDENQKTIGIIYNKETGKYEIDKTLTTSNIMGMLDKTTGELVITVTNNKKADGQKLELELNTKADTSMKIGGQQFRVILPYRTGNYLLTTNEEGKIELDLVSPGEGDHIYIIRPSEGTNEYKLKEIKLIITFDKYGKAIKVQEITSELSKKEIVSKVDKTTINNCVSLEYSVDVNDIYGSQQFRIELEDYDYNVKKLPGATYKIQVETESGIKTLVKTTDSLGEITITLPKRDWVKVIVEQTATIKGYTLEPSVNVIMLKRVDTVNGPRLEVDEAESTAGLNIQVKGKNQIITFVHDNIAKLSDSKEAQGNICFFITKKDLTGKLLGNVSFELEETVTGVKEILTTDSNGYVELHDIAIPGEGKYEFKIHELNTVAGYDLPDTEIIIDVLYENINGELKTSGIIVKKGYRYIENKKCDEYETDETFQLDFNMTILNNAKNMEEKFTIRKMGQKTVGLDKYVNLPGVKFSIQVEYPDGTSVKEIRTTKLSGIPEYAKIESNLHFEEGENILRIQEIETLPGFKLDETEKIIVVKKENGKLSIVAEKTTKGLNIGIDKENEKYLVLELKNDRMLYPASGGKEEETGVNIEEAEDVVNKIGENVGSGEQGPGGGTGDGGSSTLPGHTPAYGVYITKLSRWNHSYKVYGAVFKITVKNEDGEVIKTTQTGGTGTRFENQPYAYTYAILGYDTGKLILEIEEIVPGYVHKLNTEKYKVVIERSADGTVKLDEDASSKGIQLRVGSYRDYDWTWPIVAVYMTIENDPGYGLIVEKVDENNTNLRISGAGFSIIEASKEFDEEATVKWYGVTSGGSTMLQIRDQEENSTRRYVIKEEVLPNGYNRMGEFGKVLVDVTTDEHGYVTDAKIIEKEGYDGKDVCEVIYDQDHFAKIQIKDKPIPEPTYTIKIIKEDEKDNTIRLSGATFNVNVESEKTTTFTWPVEGVAPFPITTIEKGGVRTDMSVTTNEVGVAKATGNIGTGENVITITETGASQGYLLLDEPITVVVNREVTAVSTVEEGIVKTGSLTLNKEKTDDNVEVVIDNEKQEVVVRIKNKLSYDIEIQKVDEEDTEVKLAGSKFTLEREIFSKDENGKWKTERKDNERVLVSQLSTTGENGLTGYSEGIMLTNKMVEYILREVEAPEEYERIDEAIKFRVEYDENSNIKAAELLTGSEYVELITNIEEGKIRLVVKNTNTLDGKGINIQLVKEFEKNGDIKLEGGIFNFGINYGDRKQNIIKITNETGVINLGNILVKNETNITITELEAPEGFKTSEEEVNIKLVKDKFGNITLESSNNEKYEVLYDDENGVIKVVYKNELLRTGIGISKVTSLDNEVKISDVEFIIKDNATDDIYGLITGEDGSGIVTMPEKEKGVYEYRIKENSKVDGYKLLEEEIILQVEYNENKEIIRAEITKGGEYVKIKEQDEKYVGLEIVNEEDNTYPEYNIIVRKADRDDFEWVLPNAELKIDVDNEVGPKGITKTDLTDKNGEIAMSNLQGTGQIDIYITEITPPANRKFDSKEKYVRIIRDKETERMKLDISKNADTIIDNVNNIITIVIRNEIDEGMFNVAVEKREKNNPNIKLPKAEFSLELYNVFTERTSTGDTGVGYFEGLPMQTAGTYKFKLKELVAPAGHELIDEDIMISIKFGGESGKLVIQEAKILNVDKEIAEIVNFGKRYMKVIVYDEIAGNKGEEGSEEKPGDGDNPNENSKETYTLRINKVDEEYPEIGIAGVKFGVTVKAESGETVYVEGETGKDGILDITGLTGTGNIEALIKEITGANGYEVDTLEKKITYIREKEDKTIEIKGIEGKMTGNTFAEEKNVEVYITNQLSEEYFNMHLEKYLSHVNGEKISEGPQVILGDKISYNKPEITKELQIGDELIYTIRVYNEGTENGYAKTIIDNIPEGLEYIERHEINRKYEWKIKEIGKVETNYLSKECETEDRNNLINGYNKEEDTELDYKDLQIAFKLVGKKGENTVKNMAEIKEETDEDGNEEESAGRNEVDNKTGEEIEIKYVDLETIKYISKVIVRDTGKNTVKEYEYGEEKDGIKKIEISPSRINKTEISIEYIIKVVNNGNKAGTIASLLDNIPEGLNFDASKNTGWEIIDGKAENIDIRGTILQPGESKEVKIVLTWEKSSSNFGGLENTAIARSEEGDIDEGRAEIDGVIKDEDLKDTDNTGNATIIVGVNTGGIMLTGGIITLIIVAGALIALVSGRKFIVR